MLERASQGDDEARAEIWQRTYAELHAMARSLRCAGSGGVSVVGGSGELAASDLVGGAAPLWADPPWLAGVLAGAHCVGVSRDGSTPVVGSAVIEIRAGSMRAPARARSARRRSISTRVSSGTPTPRTPSP